MNDENEDEIVLVVDDSPDTVSMLNDALDNEGFSVLVALSGMQAVSICKKIKPDLILLDAVMPEMDGFETCKTLKQNPDLESVPVIFMTGLDSENKPKIDGPKLLCQNFSLTAREGEVLYWVSQGKSNKDLAMILGISPRTVNKHLESIFEKLLVENRTSAANMALKVINQ